MIRSFEPGSGAPDDLLGKTRSIRFKLCSRESLCGERHQYSYGSFLHGGQTGTCKLNYWKKDEYPEYQASFAGYFPADAPRYSCIVVVAKPNNSTGYYGNRVAAPVFAEIAHRLYTNDPALQLPVILWRLTARWPQPNKPHPTTSQRSLAMHCLI